MKNILTFIKSLYLNGFLVITFVYGLEIISQSTSNNIVYATLTLFLVFTLSYILIKVDPYKGVKLTDPKNLLSKISIFVLMILFIFI